MYCRAIDRSNRCGGFGRQGLQQADLTTGNTEQQAFAKHALNFVMDTYLPEKLKNPKSFLP